MERLINKIREEAYVIDNRIVKVDHFINHMLDTELVFEIGKEFSKEFPDATKILTIEASGIAFAVATAFHLNNMASSERSKLLNELFRFWFVYSTRELVDGLLNWCKWFCWDLRNKWKLGYK